MVKQTLKKSKMTPITTNKKTTVGKKPTAATIKKHIIRFQEDGLSYLKELPLDTLVAILKYANKVYYTDIEKEDAKKSNLMTDNEYDILKEHIESIDANHPALKEVGAPIKKKKVTLPYEMWSMDKIKPSTKALDNYLKKFNTPSSYVISAKLDGVSGLYSTEGDSPALYTRGNGKVGQDVSHLLRYISLPKTKGIVLRGECIAKKDSSIKNLRNVIAGLVNKIRYTDKDRDILENTLEFVAYEVISPKMSPLQQFEYLKKNKITHAFFKEEKEITSTMLSTHLQTLRDTYEYEIDGVICTHNKIYPRKSGNPDHAFAFKMMMMDQIAEAKVLDILWSPSKDGYLKPRIQIEPIELQGTTIQYATAFNAAFVKEHKLGVGAVVQIIRSGDVIPYIQKVVTPANRIKWPKEKYTWTESNIDIILVNHEENDIVKQKQLVLFFKRIEVEGLSDGTIKKFMNAGYSTIRSILEMSIDDIMKIDGFKEKSSTKLYNAIQNRLKEATLIDFMTASNLFGRGLGSKKLEAIIEVYPDLFQVYSSLSIDELCAKIVKVEGIAEKTASSFVGSLHSFVKFMKSIHQEDKLKMKSPILHLKEKKSKEGSKIEDKKSSPLTGNVYVFSGFRNKELEKKIKEIGGKVTTSVSKNTTHLVVKTKDQSGSKIEKAKKMNIPIILVEELESMI